MTEPLRAAVIGLAGIGRTHLQAYREIGGQSSLCALAVVCDVDPAVVERARREFGVESTYTDYRTLLEDPHIDLISLCVPHFLHRQIALACIASGKHLLPVRRRRRAVHQPVHLWLGPPPVAAQRCKLRLWLLDQPAPP